MTTQKRNGDIVIIGAGIIGIASAHYLSGAGFKVTVIDKATIAGACSSSNCGFICPSHVLPLAQPGVIPNAMASLLSPRAAFRIKPRPSLALITWLAEFAKRCTTRHMNSSGRHLQAILNSSIAEYRQLLGENSLDVEWQESGLLYVAETAEGMQELAENDQHLAAEFGVTARRIEGDDLPDLDPALKPGLAGAYLYECDAYLNPARLCSEWAAQLERNGVRFIEHCEVTGLEQHGGRISGAVTDEGVIAAEHFVVAAGALSRGFGKLLSCRIPIEPGKGYSLTMTRPELCPRYPMLFPEHHVGVTPFADGYRLGSMMEFVGYDKSIPEHRIQQLQDSALPYLVEPWSDTILEEWYGWRPMTWDSLPIVGAVPGLDNAWLATGHNMLGMSLGPATGRLVLEMITGQKTHIDAAAFSPSRF